MTQNCTVITTDDFGKLDQDCGVILDVRNLDEHAECQLERPHELVPLGELDPDDFMKRRGLDKGAAVYILCRSGKRAGVAAEKFTNQGYTNVHVIEGGIMACQSAGHPVTSAANTNASTPLSGVSKMSESTEATKACCPTMSSFLCKLPIERQVRAIAGSVIALGTFFGMTVHHVFFWIPLIAGVGCAVAGFTGFCMLEKMLKKASWNQGGACSTEKKECCGGGSCSTKDETPKTGGGCCS